MIELDPQEKLIYEHLINYDTNFGRMYLGAISLKMCNKEHPDNIRQCAHSIREIIEKLFELNKSDNRYSVARQKATITINKIWGNSLSDIVKDKMDFCELEDHILADLNKYLITYKSFFESEKFIAKPKQDRIETVILEISPRFVNDVQELKSLLSELISFHKRLQNISHSLVIRDEFPECNELCDTITDLLIHVFPSDELADVQDLDVLIKEAEGNDE